MKVNVELKGLSDMIRRLDRRVVRMQQTVLRQALKAFAEPIRAAAERIARANISPRIRIVVDIRIRGDAGTVRIGPPGEFFWGFFFEYGYWIRPTRKGPGITFVPARPFLRPAYAAHKEEGLKAMERILLEAFNQEIPASSSLAV